MHTLCEKVYEHVTVNMYTLIQPLIQDVCIHFKFEEGVHDICCGTILQYKMSAVELYMFISMYDDEQKN